MAQYPAASTTVNVAANKTLITKSGSSGNTILPSTTTLTTVTTDTVNLSYGSYSQIISSTASEYLLTAVYVRTADGVITGPIFLDIATGGAGSESVKASFVLDIRPSTAGYVNNSFQALAIPIRIPASTRIAARVCATSVGGGARDVAVALHVTPYTNVEGN